MKNHDVEVVDLHPLQRDINALLDALGGEVEMGRGVSAELGAEGVAVAVEFGQNPAKHDLAHPPAVVGRGVDEIHPHIHRDVHGLEALIKVDVAELGAERRGAKPHDRRLDIGFA